MRAPDPSQLPALTRMGERSIGAPLADPAVVAAILSHDPQSLFVFERNGVLLGGIAFLHLSDLGHRQMRAGTLALASPAPDCLASPEERPTSIYVWALFGRGRASTGIARVAVTLRGPRFWQADLYARPMSDDGRRFLGVLGFVPLEGAGPMPALHRYGRRCPSPHEFSEGAE